MPRRGRPRSPRSAAAAGSAGRRRDVAHRGARASGAASSLAASGAASSRAASVRAASSYGASPRAAATTWPRAAAARTARFRSARSAFSRRTSRRIATYSAAHLAVRSRRVDRVGRRALRDGPGEEPARRRRRHQRRDRVAARRLAEHRDARGIAAEGGDVLPHPSEQRDLVAQPEVALERALAGAVAREVEVAERAEPVVEAHVHDAPAAHEPLALTREVPRRARAVSPAVDEHHHRQGRPARLPDGCMHVHASGSPRRP